MNSSLIALAVVAAFTGQMPQDQPPAAPEPATDRQEEFSFLKEKATELSLFRGADANEPQPLKAEPVLRYSNSERDIGSLDGSTFLWLVGKRPLAAVSTSVRKLNSGAYRECTSFSSAPLVCRTGQTTVWSPKTGGLLDRPLEDAAAPAAGKPQRLTQMRSLARRFTASCYNPRSEEPTELRLLPQPLYRFEDDAAGILDGALFAFVVSNDPELFLLMEARSDVKEGESAWRYSLARMSSQKETVRLDGKEIWSVPNYWRDPAEDRKTGPYVEAKVGTFVPRTRE
ncbi:MAG TPA: hypothetical protein VFB96_20565 [Pirellulaceae bacterium]|nr:hypothetical protein [Pirellulaceae bacterium]